MKVPFARRFAAIFTIFLGGITAGGCAYDDSFSPNALDYQGKLIPSGFLSDYSKLHPSRRKEGAYVFLDRSAKFSHYKLIMLDPVQVKLHPEAAASKLDPRRIDDLARRFETELQEVLNPSYPIVNQPGFGVLRVRLAVTDVVPNDPLLNVTPGASMLGLGLGGASIEGEFIDTQTQKQVAAFVDSEAGKGHRKRAIFSTTGQGEDRLRGWAILLKDRLDEAQGLHVSSDFRTSGRLFE